MQSRREFHASLLGSLAAYGLIESLFTNHLFAADVKPVLAKWFRDLYDLSQSLFDKKLKDVEFQTKMEELYKKVDLASLIEYVELDRLQKVTSLPDNGAKSLGFDLSKIEGLPKALNFGKQIFAMKKGRSVVPHGHENMCTGFIILRGDFHGRHFDRLETNPDHYIIAPTIDRAFKIGEVSTISDHKDNIHWFEATSDVGFIFNVHVTGYDKTITSPSGRLYVDVDGEKLPGGKIKAAKMTSTACHKKYGQPT